MMTLGEIRALIKLEGLDKFNKDLTDADGKMSKGSKSLKEFSDSAVKLGDNLTKKLTLPLVVAAGATLKLAADAEVSARKFDKAFEGVGTDAAAEVEVLNEQFGISNTQATRLLANTADLLKGFGATGKEALKLSKDTQQLAAALAAYNGVPVEQASIAITKAMLGERESIKLLGVAIRETDVQQRLLEQGKQNLTGEALNLAKAEATLALAFQQSQDAVGSFAENQDTLAFQTQALVGDLKDLGVQFGDILIPAAKEVVEVIGEVVDWFSDLDEGTKRSIVQMAALAASVGPVISIVGRLGQAISFLAANPYVLLAAGLAAITIATINYNKELREQQELSDEILEGGTSGSLEKDLQVQTERYEALNEQIESIKRNREQGFDISESSIQYLYDEKEALEQNIQSIKDAKDARDNLLAAQARWTAENERGLAILAKQNEELARQNKVSADVQERVTTLTKEIKNLDDLQASGAYTEIELINQKIKLRKEVLDSIQEQGKLTGRLSDEEIALIQLQRSEIERYYKRLENLEEDTSGDIEQNQRDRLSLQEEYQRKILQQANDRLGLLDLEYQKEIETAEAIGADTQQIDEYYAIEKKNLIEEMAAAEEAAVDKSIESTEELINKVKEAAEDIQLLTAQIQEIITPAIQGLNSEINKLQEEYDALDDQESERAKAILEEQKALKKAQKGLEDLGNTLTGLASGAVKLAAGDLTGLVDIFTTLLSPAIDQLGAAIAEDAELMEGLTEISDMLVELGVALIPIIVELLKTLVMIIEPFLPILIELAEIWADLSEIMGPMQRLFLQPLIFGLKILAGVLGFLGDIVEEVTNFFQPLIDMIDKFLDILDDLFGWLVDAADAVGGVGDFLGDVAGGVGDFVGDVVGGVGKFFGGLFADGGVTTGSTPVDLGNGKIGIAGEAGPEAILPLNDSTFNMLADSIVGAMQGGVVSTAGGNIDNYIVLDGEVIAKSTTSRINNGQNTIKQRAIVR